MFTYTQCPKSEAKRSDVQYGHALLLLLGTQPAEFKYAECLRANTAPTCKRRLFRTWQNVRYRHR